MLTAKFFPWPYPTDSLVPAILEIKPIIEKSSLKGMLDGNTSGPLDEYIAYAARCWNINPWWVMVSAEREQSAWTQNHLSASNLNAFCGFVEEDQGRVTLPGLYGVYTQILRICEQSAWLLGIVPAEAWPLYVKKTVARFSPLVPHIMRVKDEKNEPVSIPVTDPGEFLQLSYTPHLEVLETNQLIAEKMVPKKYWAP